MVGLSFGRLTVIHDLGHVPGTQRRCLVRCTCGRVKAVFLGNMKRGLTRSCGCLHRELTSVKNRRHGDSHTYLHTTWCNIRRRCYDSKHPAYRNYGGRGIAVCDDWRRSYEAFRDYVLQHLGHRPLGYTLDRINNDGHYEPGNVRWADRTTQANNQRPHRQLSPVERRRRAQRFAATLRRNGTRVRGERHPAAKLNEMAVRVIRFLSARGFSRGRLARAHNVSRASIRHIVSGTAWAHVA